ncbi:MAG: DUF58 domain-containing protein [Bacteroidota bacterium]|nr:DUF58 domain-containing protein [Bacteroidota bacterium]|tara:strand:+ start:1293 stop:2156 length:864 start_codon:yes stop_codon:yes gene_type:complete
MNTKELLKKVRKIEIKTRKLSDHIFGGEYHSTFKGRGMTFSEVRQYQIGDDVRAIDWNVTARYNEPFVKVFEEERELTMMLIVDISGSEFYGTSSTFKNEYLTEIAATLAFSANQNNDKVGLILFTDQVELYIPPKKGKPHILRIIRELIEFKPTNKKTDINAPLQFVSKILKNRAIVFLMSDFISDNYSNSLRIISSKHDITGIRVYDKSEITIPNLGLVHLMDNEANKMKLVYTGSKKIRKKYENYYTNRIQLFEENFKKAGAGIIECSTTDSYQKKLLRYFRNR